MKLTKTYLRKIIKEEVKNTMENALDDAASGFVGGDEPEYTGPDLSNLLQDFEENIEAIIKAATTGADFTPEKDRDLSAVFQSMVKARNLLRKYLDEDGPSGDRMGLKGMTGRDSLPRSRGKMGSERYNTDE